jgi:DHA1 family tetracycline resistance protein-like MFS transporter
MTRRVSPFEQGELQGAIASLRGIAMLIGPGLFSLTFACFIAPEHPLPGARAAAVCESPARQCREACG